MKPISGILLLLLPIAWASALAEDSGEESPDALATSIEAHYIYLAPTVARLHGSGFSPGVTLWIDVTDPLDNVVTSQVATDPDGRFIADVAVDEPGVYQTRVRTLSGQVVVEGNLLVGLQ